jgi:hypothetical protein
VTEPGPTTATDAPAPNRRRPVLVELASALLIVGGALTLLISIQVAATLGTQGEEVGALTLITVALAAATFVLGLLVRYGRAWLLTINVVAVIAFLELTSGSSVGLFLGALDTFVVLALVRERPWFAETPAEPESDLRSYGG